MLRRKWSVANTATDPITREYQRGKYHCTIDLLFDRFGISCDNFCFYSQNRLTQTSQTGGQRYSDTSPFRIPCHNLTVWGAQRRVLMPYSQILNKAMYKHALAYFAAESMTLKEKCFIILTPKWQVFLSLSPSDLSVWNIHENLWIVSFRCKPKFSLLVKRKSSSF